MWITFIYFVAFGFFFTQVKWVKALKLKSWTLWVLWLLKALAGTGLVWLYGHYYNPEHADIYLYFNDAQVIKQGLEQFPADFLNFILGHKPTEVNALALHNQLNFWDLSEPDGFVNERHTIILLNVLLSYLTGSQIYGNALIMSFVALLGQIGLYRFLILNHPKQKAIILLVVFAIPAVLIWNSSILKEPLLFLSMGWGLYFSEQFLRSKRKADLFLSLIFLFLGLIVKPYVSIFMFMAWAVYVLFRNRELSFTKQSRIVFLTFIGCVIGLFLVNNTPIDPIQKIKKKQIQFIKNIEEAEKIEKVGSKIEFTVLSGSVHNFMWHSVSAFAKALIRPSFFDAKKPMYWPDILQTTILIIMLMFALRYPNSIEPSQFALLWFYSLFILGLLILVGLTTPVLGALVRYRTPVLIFEYVLVLQFMNTSILESKLYPMLYRK